MKIEDDYLTADQMQALNELHIEYAKVHWIGYEYNSKKNPLIDLVLSTKPVLQDRAHGATAWYNVRPIDPVWHSDILSYNDNHSFINTPVSGRLVYTAELLANLLCISVSYQAPDLAALIRSSDRLDKDIKADLRTPPTTTTSPILQTIS